MRNTGSGQAKRGGQLVVGPEQGTGPVEDCDASVLQPPERLDAGLDPVHRREHVEPAESDVPRAKAPFGVIRVDDRRIDAEAARCLEQTSVGGCQSAGHDGKAPCEAERVAIA